MTGILVTGAVLGYLAIVALISYYGYTQTGDEVDFLVAGRRIGPIVGAGTLLASQISASTVIGAVGIHYVYGISFIWIWLGVLAGWLVALGFVAPQLRRFGGMTIPDFIGTRYADDGAGGDYARAVSALLIVGVFTVFLTAQYAAGSLILRELFGVSDAVGVGLVVAIAVAYTSFGGMQASVLTDFFQAVVLVGGLSIAVPLTVTEVGGAGEFLSRLQSPAVGHQLGVPDIGGFVLASVFGIAVAPQIVSRFYAMRDVRTVRFAIGLSLVAQVCIALAVATLGIGARMLFPGLGTPDMAAVVLSQGVLGPVLGTVFVVALLSAILSTVDSVLLVASSGIAHDIYAQLVRPEASHQRKLRINRVAVLVVGVVPGVLTLYREFFGGLITLIALLNLSLQGGMLFVPVLLGLHWRRATTAGGIGAMIAGFGTVLCWHIATELGIVPGSVTGVVTDPIVPGMVASFSTLVVASVLTEGPSAGSTEPFFERP